MDNRYHTFLTILPIFLANNFDVTTIDTVDRDTIRKICLFVRRVSEVSDEVWIENLREERRPELRRESRAA